VLAAALTAAAIFAGCGGDDGGDDSTSSEAKTDFIAKADQLCTQVGEDTNEAVQKRLGADPSEGGKPPVVNDDDVIAIYEDITIPALEGLFDDIAKLQPPPGDEDEIDAIVEAADQALAEAKKDPKILAKPPGEGNPFDDVNHLEQDYGFQVCGAIADNPDAGSQAG
jgi:hypothetical protein